MLRISFHSFYSRLPNKIPLEVGCSHPTRSFLDKYFYYMETKTTFTNFKLWLKYYISLHFGIFLSLPSFLLAALCMSFPPLTSLGSGAQDASCSRRRTAGLVNGGLVCPSLPSADDLEGHRRVHSKPGWSGSESFQGGACPSWGCALWNTVSGSLEGCTSRIQQGRYFLASKI